MPFTTPSFRAPLDSPSPPCLIILKPETWETKPPILLQLFVVKGSVLRFSDFLFNSINDRDDPMLLHQPRSGRHALETIFVT